MPGKARCLGTRYNVKTRNIHVKWSEVKVSHLVMSNSLWPHGLYSPRNSLSQNTGVDCLSLLQGIFPIQGSNPGLLHCRQILYQLSHKGSPRTLEWVAYPFSSGASWPRNGTGVSCIAGGFYTKWAAREAQVKVAQSCPTLCDPMDYTVMEFSRPEYWSR